MPRIAYKVKKMSAERLAIVAKANTIIEEYAKQGFDLTLRQLYYQFVARALIPNTTKSYKQLGSIISDGRLCGHIDWDSIVDRTRKLRRNGHWLSPSQIIRTCVNQFQIDKWKGQEFRPEIWIEKDALIGVIAGVCESLDVSYFSCRGYVSQSEMWATAQRLDRFYEKPIIFHLGDHDPSGIDMTRDIQDRLDMFMEVNRCEVKRIALNHNQVLQYTPPPNPTKLADTRAAAYISQFGSDSWELDALEPTVIADLITKNVKSVRDDDLWDERVAEEAEHLKDLGAIADNWSKTIKFVKGEIDET